MPRKSKHPVNEAAVESCGIAAPELDAQDSCVGEVLLRTKDVCLKLSISRTTLYRMVQDGRMPKPVYLGKGYPRWPKSSIDALLVNN